MENPNDQVRCSRVLHLIFITIRKSNLRRLCFYTCLSFCSWGGGGVSASMHAGIYTPWADTPPPPPGKLPQADTPLANTPWANTPRVVTSTPVHAGIQCPVHAVIDMATVADGTHPTGMHSCLCCFWSFFVF